MNPQHWIHLPICSHLGSISCLDPDPYRGQDQDPYLNKKYKDPQHWVHELITKALTVCTNKTTLVALIAYVQWCGSALIVCGSGSTKVYKQQQQQQFSPLNKQLVVSTVDGRCSPMWVYGFQFNWKITTRIQRFQNLQSENPKKSALQNLDP